MVMFSIYDLLFENFIPLLFAIEINVLVNFSWLRCVASLIAITSVDSYMFVVELFWGC
jgi:hypothetical protein